MLISGHNVLLAIYERECRRHPEWTRKVTSTSLKRAPFGNAACSENLESMHH